MKHLEIKTIEHKGIRVRIKINYDTSVASLVEWQPANDSTKVKEWIFANRGLEYMGSWINIIEAMAHAVRQCQKDLEADLAEKSKFKEETTENIILAVGKK